MRIAACQMVSGLDPEKNLQDALLLIRSAVQSGAELVVLPEHFALMPTQEADLLKIAEPFGNGPIQNALSEIARTEQIWLCAGSIPLKGNDDEHIIHSSIIYCPDGEVRARYDKIHLFHFDQGVHHFCESAMVQAGEHTQTTSMACWDGEWKVGMSICYDLRFPELFRALGGPDIITIPASFITTTGRAHWDPLVRARAIENQCYVVAAAQGGKHENGRETWGPSLVVDPWGQTVAELTQGEGVLLADIRLERIKEVREMMPSAKTL